MKIEMMEKQIISDTHEGIGAFKGRKESSTMSDIGLLTLRLVVGGLLAGHVSGAHLFGIRLPGALVVAVAIVEAGMVAIGIMSRPTPPVAPSVEQQVATPVEAGRGTGTT